MIEGASDDPLTKTTFNNGDKGMENLYDLKERQQELERELNVYGVHTIDELMKKVRSITGRGVKITVSYLKDGADKMTPKKNVKKTDNGSISLFWVFPDFNEVSLLVII